MSKEIDERVVEMRFDNEHFEKNVQTSMSTLDKFKQKLQFKNVGKGFNDVEKAAKNTDLSPLAKSADTVGLRFNAMYTIADQAFRNITNSAMAAGKRIVSALTIDPIKTGLSEYETKMNAVQVIQANTRGKDTMEDITAALEELNVYADKTIYNFAQMTSNVGKFTAQGFRAKEAATAVKGLANLAAASGAGAEDMARATYQMSQALGGTIRMIDWNSLRNANMATVDLKNTLMDLARVNGVAIDDMIAKHGTFEQTLQEGWLTGKMFSEAMNIYSGIYSEAELKAKGFTDKQIANFMDLAKMAEAAATEVKTFTQLFDVLKETAQSGWTQTWELIFGDSNTAKKMFTELQVYFGDIINAFSDARNMLIGGALNLKNPWSKIYEKLENSSIGKTINAFNNVSESVKDASNKVEYFQKIVNDVWRGDYKNSDTGRYDLLEAAGYNHKVVQDLVNKGYEYKLTIEDIEESHKKFGLTLDENAESAEVVSVKFKEITDEQLEQAGLTKEEIKLYRALADEAERTGVKMFSLVNEMSENDGRTMLIDSVKNAWSGLVTILTAVRDAWVNIFPPMTVVQLYNITKAVKKFSEHLIVHEETAENLTKTLKGLFAVLDIILTVVSLPVKIAFKLLTQLLGVLNLDILSVTAVLGDMLVGFRNTVDSALDFTSVLKKIVPPIQNAIKAFMGWIDTLKESENLPKDIADGITRWFSKAIKTVTGWFSNLGNILQNGFGDVSDNAILGLINGLWNGLKVAGEVIVTLGETLINKICEVLGIHSPSVVFFAIGGFIVAGLLLGIKTFFPEIFATISDYALYCVDIIKNIDFGSVFSAVLSSVTAVALLKFADAVQNFGQMFGGLDEMLENVGVGVKRALTGFKRALSGIGASFRAKAVKDIAISLLILAGALVVLSFVPTDRLIAATVAIGVLGVVLGGLFIILNKTAGGEFGKEAFKKIGALILTMVGIAASILLLAKALETVANVNFADNWLSILGGILSIVVMLGLVMTELVLTTKFIKGVDFAKLAITIGALSGLMLVMAVSMKIFSGLNAGDFGKGIAFVTSFGIIVAALAALSQKSVNMKTAQIGSLVKNVGIAMLLMAVTCKIIAGMTWGELGKAAVGIIGFAAIAMGLIYITKFATDKDVAAAGKVISSVGVAMLLMTIAGKIINTMTWEEMFQAMVGIAALSLIITGLIAATRLASGKDLAKVGTTILMISVAIGVLALVASLLSFMDLEHLAKGITAVTILGTIMAAMILATSKAQKCLGNLIVMVVAITLMASAVATLSLIDTSKLLASTGSMTAMMLSFAAIIAATKFVNKEALGSLIVLTVIVGVLAGLVVILSLINAEKALTSTLALVTLMSTMGILLIVLSKFKIDVANAFVGILGLTAMLIPLWAFALSLAAIPSLAGKEKDIIVLVGVMTVMTTLLLITAAVGAIYTATAGVAATGLLGLLAMIGLLWLFSVALANLEDFSSNIPIIETLISVMTTMTDLLVKIAIVGPLALIGVTALVALSALMVGFGAFATGVGYLVGEFPQLKTFLDTGIPILEQLAHGLGSIVSNFLTGLLSGLPEIGTLLSEFIKEADGFIVGVKKVDGGVLAGIGILVGAFTALTAMDFISSIRSFFSGGKSPFESFGTGLSSLGKTITDFADSMSSFTDDQLAAVKRGATALKYIAEAAAAIPNSGGVAGFFAGNNDIDEFIKMIVGNDKKIGLTGLIDYLSHIDVVEGDVDKIELVSDIMVALSKAAKDVPNSGGVAGFFAGNNDIDEFIKMIVGDEGENGINDLINTLSSIDIDNATADEINQVTSIVTAIINAATSIKNNTNMNFSNFGYNIVVFADNFRKFVDKLSKIKTEAITGAISKVKELITLCNTFSSDSVQNLANFGAAISDIAKGGIDSFVKTFTSTTSTDSAKKAVNTFLDNVISKVKTKGNKQKFSSLGKYLVEGLRDGITNNESIVTTAVKNLASKLVTTAQDELDINSPSLVFKKEVGYYICEGITEGITEDTSPEEALEIKMGNLYEAYLDLKSKWSKESPLPSFFDFISSSVRNSDLGRYESKLRKEATAAGMIYGDYVTEFAAGAYVDKQNGKPVKQENAMAAVKEQYENDIKNLEDKKKKIESDYKWSKLGSAIGLSDKVENKKNYLANQIDINNQLLAQYEKQIKEYQVLTDAQTDGFIADIRAKMVTLKEENADFQKQIDTAAAEEAAETAANINEQFKETLDRIKSDMTMEENKYRNWVASYPNAKQSVKHSKLLEYLDIELKLLKEQEATYKQKVNAIAAATGTNSEEYRTAYGEWVQARVDMFDKEEEISDTQEQHLLALEEADDNVRETEYALWLARNKDASELTKLAREHQYLNDSLKDAEEESAKLYEEYLKVVEREGDMSAEAVKTALAEWNKSVKNEIDIRNQINDNKEAQVEAAEEASDRLRDSTYELWVSENESASDHEKLTKKLTYIEESILDAEEDVVKAQEEYNKALSAENADATEINNKLSDLNEAKKTRANLQQKKNDIEDSILSLVQEEKSIASDIAKLNYDIWEKTEGRNATDAEKELKQMEYLNQQSLIQSQLSKEALKEYTEAISKYGSDSIEATRAYREYLNEVYSLAELKSQILDLEESSADRQKRLQDKQDLAKTEYEDYIKKYEKYYIANGMSRADLEKDAKLVSGYDPTNVVNKITSKTKSAIETVATSSSYRGILTSFSDMGSSYVKAMGEGASVQLEGFTDNTYNLVVECSKKIAEARPLWVDAGEQLVTGLIQGITDYRSNAINAAYEIAVQMLSAARSALGIESPSKEFAEIGKYSILGFVRGLVDNSVLSDEAATNIGNSAIENLKSSIRKISDVVESDLDTQPTIRPVLDLSNIRTGTARLNAMMSTTQALAISDSRKARERSDENQNGSDSSTSTGNTYQFTQNNYSPKALSRTEIYRQTKNQFAAMKEVLA